MAARIRMRTPSMRRRRQGCRVLPPRIDHRGWLHGEQSGALSVASTYLLSESGVTWISISTLGNVPGGLRSTLSLRTRSGVLVGRDDELRAGSVALSRLPAVVFIEGEAGIGKTRLVTELVRGLRGRFVAIGHCQPLIEPFPYGPVLD